MLNLLGIASLAFWVTACQTAGGGGQLKIGTLLPLTGDLAQYGQPMQDSANLLVETVNDCGGVMGQPVQLVAEDDQTQPAAGANGMTKLAEVDQVGAVIGAAGSAVSAAAVDIAVRNQVVQISPSSTSPSFTDRAQKGDFNGFWFRTAPPDNFQGEALAQLAKEQGFQRVAVLAVNNDYGNGLLQAFTTGFEKQGGTVVNKDKPALFSETASTFDAEISAAFAGEPDAVLLIAYPEKGSLILKAAQEQGLLGKETKVMTSDGMKTDQLAQLVGRTTDNKLVASGIIGTAPAAGGPGIEAFRQAYKAKFPNRDPQVYDPNTWDATAIVVLAAEAAKSTSGAAIRDKIREVADAPGEEVSDVCQALALVREGRDINYQGASGTVDFNEAGDVVGSYDVWTVADDGKIQVKSTINVSGS
jgi:branched-chain amino acid transport system substrate-binding protein/neutral amino acid transport system substrate-binding protein